MCVLEIQRRVRKYTQQESCIEELWSLIIDHFCEQTTFTKGKLMEKDELT